MGYSSGYLAKELGLGVAGVLPSKPDFPVVLHGSQTRSGLEAITRGPVTQADLDAARALAARNENLDSFVRQTLAEGARYGAQKAGQLNQRRMAGMALGGAAGGAGLMALIDYLQSPKIETKE